MSKLNPILAGSPQSIEAYQQAIAQTSQAVAQWLQQPEMYLSGVGSWFNDAGVIEKEETRQFLAQFAQTFADWIEKTAPVAK